MLFRSLIRMAAHFSFVQNCGDPIGNLLILDFSLEHPESSRWQVLAENANEVLKITGAPRFDSQRGG